MYPVVTEQLVLTTLADMLVFANTVSRQTPLNQEKTAFIDTYETMLELVFYRTSLGLHGHQFANTYKNLSHIFYSTFLSILI